MTASVHTQKAQLTLTVLIEVPMAHGGDWKVEDMHQFAAKRGEETVRDAMRKDGIGTISVKCDRVLSISERKP